MRSDRLVDGLMRRGGASVLIGLVVLAPIVGCGGKPWGLIVRASQSELKATALAQDRLLESELRRTLIANHPTTALEISPHVYMERGFVVGSVASNEERSDIIETARGVDGFRSLEFFLPVSEEPSENAPEPATGSTGSDPTETSDDGEAGGIPADWTTSAELRGLLVADPTIVSSRVEVEVVAGQIVLLGVVDQGEQERVLDRVASVAPDQPVQNWMLIPESGYTKRVRLLR